MRRKDAARDTLPVSRNAKWALPASWRPEYGAKTTEGIERIRLANTKHGRYTARAIAERAEYRKLLRACREMLAGLL
jgi:hypothetical protein